MAHTPPDLPVHEDNMTRNTRKKDNMKEGVRASFPHHLQYISDLPHSKRIINICFHGYGTIDIGRGATRGRDGGGGGGGGRGAHERGGGAEREGGGAEIERGAKRGVKVVKTYITFFTMNP